MTSPLTYKRPTERAGDWMQTFTGRQFWPMDPRPEDLDILDIAHALSLLCRFGGHCQRFYSVAEHSVHVARSLPRHLQLWGLLHDASEAYLVDVPRPVKPFLEGYADAERAVMLTIIQRYWLELGDAGNFMPTAVKQADNRILVDERQQNMASGREWGSLSGLVPLGVTLQYWAPGEAESQFLDLFYALKAEQEAGEK